MIALVRAAQSAGVDAAQIYSLDLGHGRMPRADEQDAYLRDVLDATAFPSVISIHQSVGYFLDPELIGRLLDDYPHVIGVNCTHPDLTYLARLIDIVGDRAELDVGGPMHALSALALGADGYLVSEANLAPRLCAGVTSAWARSDLAGGEQGLSHRHAALHRRASARRGQRHQGRAHRPSVSPGAVPADRAS